MYKLLYLPLVSYDILEIEAGLNEFSSAAADRLTEEINDLTQTLTEHPLMYQVFEDDDYYRSMPLCYEYRLFYHVEERTKTIEIHRVLHGVMDLKSRLQE